MLAKICFCSGFVGARAGASTAAAKLLSKAHKEDQPTVSEQKGRGVPGQYVYWITFLTRQTARFNGWACARRLSSTEIHFLSSWSRCTTNAT